MEIVVGIVLLIMTSVLVSHGWLHLQSSRIQKKLFDEIRSLRSEIYLLKRRH